MQNLGAAKTLELAKVKHFAILFKMCLINSNVVQNDFLNGQRCMENMVNSAQGSQGKWPYYSYLMKNEK